MGMTIAEKIIAAAAGVDYVKPGDIHTVKEVCTAHTGTECTYGTVRTCMAVCTENQFS